ILNMFHNIYCILHNFCISSIVISKRFISNFLCSIFIFIKSFFKVRKRLLNHVVDVYGFLSKVFQFFILTLLLYVLTFYFIVFFCYYLILFYIAVIIIFN